MEREVPIIIGGLNKAKRLLEVVMNKWTIKKSNSLSKESVNLYDESNGNFVDIKTSDSPINDLSLLDPKQDSKFWEKIDIASTDIIERYYGENKLYESLDMDFPT